MKGVWIGTAAICLLALTGCERNMVSAAFLPKADVVALANDSMAKQKRREANILSDRIVRGNPAKKQIALTFDDGPHGSRTELLLSILKKYDVRATFFVVGKMVDKNPGLVRKIAADGHEIANHTYHHWSLVKLTPEQIVQEIQGGAEAIKRAVGMTTRLYRPPGGVYDGRVETIARKLGQVMVLWTVDPHDFSEPGPRFIEKKTLEYTENGAIILLHDGVYQTMDALPGLITRLKSQGYSFVTCSEMGSARGVITVGGPRIRPNLYTRAQDKKQAHTNAR